MRFSKRVTDLLTQMTVNEKIGQTAQVYAGFYHEGGVKLKELTGPILDETLASDAMWNIGSIIDNIAPSRPEKKREIQEEYLKHNRLKIPLLFMGDIIHGYQTCFPIPLALSCAFEEGPAFDCARTSAIEARATGMHVAFSPMVDLARDCRWGRVMEGPGEDPFIGRMMARAFVKGYQGETVDELSRNDRIASTMKHFAGYGFVMGGRDYDETDISEMTLREFALPAFQEGIDAGAQGMMSTFTTFEGIPANGSKKLMKDILRDDLGFDGFLISDSGSINNICKFHVAETGKDASEMAINATCDIDMNGFRYLNDIKALLAEGKITMEQLDTMVGRVLTLKERIGLFDDPFKGMEPERTDSLRMCDEHRSKARKAARKSAVLLQNKKNILPFSKEVKTVAVIGPNGGDVDLNGNWSFQSDMADTVKIYQGIQNALPDAHVLVEAGCDFVKRDTQMLRQAVAAAKEADAVVLALGEKITWAGEACSTTSIRITKPQIELAKAVVRANPNTVAVLVNGRPMDLSELCGIVPAVMECWFMGLEAGNAIADLLFGDYEPTGRLSMSFPRTVGQVPVYYNRPHVCHYTPDGSPNVWYRMRYTDCSLLPLFAFGHGLGYTKFAYKCLSVPKTMKRGKEITVSCIVVNKGARTGTETVQMYIRDDYAQIIRPLKELKGVQKVTLAPGEQQKVTFTITEDMLKYHHTDMNYSADAGVFQVFIGHDSTVEKYKEFTLVDSVKTKK